jgi:hypothetical protein
MGLDMYLSAKRYVSEYRKSDEALRGELDKLSDLTGGLEIQEVSCEAMYWRKANAIHDWFVKNVQGGVDNCGEYFVPREKLQELLELCKEVMANKGRAVELLPTASGFFFGSTDFDDYYFEDVQSTITRLEELLSNSEIADNFEFYYQSSW